MDKIDLVIDKIENLKEHHAERLESIDKNLKEHMRRTDVLEQLHKDNEKRIEHLEQPRKLLKYAKNVLISIGTLAGAIYAILRIIE